MHNPNLGAFTFDSLVRLFASKGIAPDSSSRQDATIYLNESYRPRLAAIFIAENYKQINPHYYIHRTNGTTLAVSPRTVAEAPLKITLG